MFNYTGLLTREAEHIPGAFDPDLVTIEDIARHLSYNKVMQNELQIINPSTQQKVMVRHVNSPWRNCYDPDTLEYLWENGHTFIVESPYINNKVKQITKSIENSNFVCCDAHVYCGKKGSKSFPPHSDDSNNLIVQCKGKTYWRVWSVRSGEPSVFKELEPQRADLEFIMEPGDALILPINQVHKAEPMTDRISVSFPFVPGPKGVFRDMEFSWDD